MRHSTARIIAVVAVAIAAAGCGGASRTVTGTEIVDQRSAAGKPSGAAAAEGGDLVGDGGFAFAVLDVARARRVGDLEDPALSITAQGEFIVITLSVHNVGTAPLTFIDRDQTLIDNTGRSFSTSMAANIYGNLGIGSTKIGPGKSLTVKIAFDVPVDTLPGRLVLRESASSAGATVSLS